MDSPCVNTVVVNMRVIPIPAHAGITGFESPAAEYGQLAMSLDDLLVGIQFAVKTVSCLLVLYKFTS